MTYDLTLPQALLLLCLNDASGKSEGAFFQPAIAGAALAELHIVQAIELTNDAVPQVTPLRHKQSLSTFLGLCDTEIGRASKPQSVEHWIQRITNSDGLVATVADELCHLGILSKARSSVLGIFSRTVWPTVSPQAETALRSRLAAIMFEAAEPTPREIALLALAEAAGVLPNNFDVALLETHAAQLQSLFKSAHSAGSPLMQIAESTGKLIAAASLAPDDVAAAITT